MGIVTGNILLIYHYGGFRTIYGHLSEIIVTKGEEINEGQLIGRVGDSGSITGPVLHFEIWQNKAPVNPENWLSKK